MLEGTHVKSVQCVAGQTQVFVSLKLCDISGSRPLILILLAVGNNWPVSW